MKIVARYALISTFWIILIGGCVRIKSPKIVKLCDSSQNTDVAVVWPHGADFDLVLGVPSSENKLPKGFVQIIQNGSVVYDTPFDAAELKECNWLHKDKTNGYIINWDKNGGEHPLDKIMEQGGRYSVRCKLEGSTVNTPIELWLHYMTNAGI